MMRLAHRAVCSAAVAVFVAAPAFASTGDISTAAGTGVAGFGGDAGFAGSAQLNLPRSVAAISTGGFLIADRENNRVRRVWPDGAITTVAGSGPIGAANGDFSGDGGPATDARLDFLHAAVPTPDGGFLISDTRNQRIRYVSAGGTITTVAGSGPFGTFGSGGFTGDLGPATAARLNNPHGVAIDPAGGYLVADTDNNRVRRVDPGGTITTVAGSGPTGNGNGGYAGDGGPATAALLDRPFGVEPIAGGGFLVVDTGNQVIRHVGSDGTIATVAGLPGNGGFSGDDGPATAARLSSPHSVAATADGAFLIADKNNQRVRRVAPDGTINTVAGSGPTGDANGSYGGDGGSALAASLNRPKGVAVTATGFLMADESNNRIRFVDLGVPSSSGTGRAPPSLTLSLEKHRLRIRVRGIVKLRFTASAEALIHLEIRRRGRLLASLQQEAGIGPNTILLGRRLTRNLAPGHYRLILDAAADDGQHAEAVAKLTVRRSP